MTLRLHDQIYLLQHFPESVAEVGTDWAPWETSPDTQENCALPRISKCVKMILNDIGFVEKV